MEREFENKTNLEQETLCYNIKAAMKALLQGKESECIQWNDNFDFKQAENLIETYLKSHPKAHLSEASVSTIKRCMQGVSTIPFWDGAKKIDSTLFFKVSASTDTLAVVEKASLWINNLDANYIYDVMEKLRGVNIKVDFDLHSMYTDKYVQELFNDHSQIINGEYVDLKTPSILDIEKQLKMNIVSPDIHFIDKSTSSTSDLFVTFNTSYYGVVSSVGIEENT